jgi:hypothetical protein
VNEQRRELPPREEMGGGAFRAWAVCPKSGGAWSKISGAEHLPDEFQRDRARMFHARAFRQLDIRRKFF